MEGGSQAIEELDRLNLKQLMRLAKVLGRLAYPSLNLLLVGDLGAGKTTFTRGFARGLGVDERLVRSPSFAIMYIYTGRLELIHVDLYRLNDPQEVFYTGVLDYFDSDEGVLVIEWADRLEDNLPESWVRISFFIEDSEHRKLLLEGKGDKEVRYLKKSMEVFKLAREAREAG
ncbi:MAG: tRNA (adenosine(37)-N6)-threonylcarbamoyltransferase complex ATPase subunit type 1 TsaE [Thermotogae bacterium]|nr:MAG: tRNA (adenosine(37)-N6)-threonylcarbamoyltransferase complex ATPase subunit type 1 TsaE [Thermotogota bacterium]